MIFNGTAASNGIAIATILYMHPTIETVERKLVDDTQKQTERFESARALAAVQLGRLAVSTAEKLGKENSLLFEIHQMMLEDLDYRESVEEKIQQQKFSAEYAVSETAKEFSEGFAQMDDEYMQARSADVLDVSRRVIEILLGIQSGPSSDDGPHILAAKDFAPSETAQMERQNTLALITIEGSSNSHTAIFARTMGIPAVISIGNALNDSWDGKLCIVDGGTGIVILDPDEGQLKEYKERQNKQLQQKQLLEEYRGKISRTKGGRQVKLYANIGNVQDARLAMENDAEGIGLFRSEFLYLESKNFPSEELQFEAYKSVAETMEGRSVIIRTLDIGADKQANYFELPKEENPALGLRALRLCLKRPDVFKTQLKAIYRASVFGKLAIMLPMVSSVWEVKQSKELIAQVKSELQSKGIDFDDSLPVGIMIETPAAAITSDLLAKEVDFFSIGTNDLTQYTLAVDRQNADLTQYADSHHPAILRLISQTVENAHNAGIWCGICGELGSDHSLTERFLEMGVDELSVTPPAVLPLRKHICEMD